MHLPPDSQQRCNVLLTKRRSKINNLCLLTCPIGKSIQITDAKILVSHDLEANVVASLGLYTKILAKRLASAL